MDAEATVLNRFGCSGFRPEVVAFGVKPCTSRTEHGVLDNFTCISAARGVASKTPPCFPAPPASEASASCWEGMYRQPARQANPPGRQSELLELRLSFVAGVTEHSAAQQERISISCACWSQRVLQLAWCLGLAFWKLWALFAPCFWHVTAAASCHTSSCMLHSCHARSKRERPVNKQFAASGAQHVRPLR